VEEQPVVDERAAIKGRPRTGEDRKCVDCGEDIYVRKYRIDKDLDAEYRCRKCSSKRASKHARPPKRKEVPMVNTPAPPKPPRRNKRQANLEENKEAIIRDYYAMTIREFLPKWHISTTAWHNMRESWGLKPKHKVVQMNLMAEQTGFIDWKLKYETYRQAVLDIFGDKSPK